MDYLSKIFIALLLISTTSCYHPKLVQREMDIQRVVINKELFIGKPLNDLLKEIKPPIKRVTATPSKNILSYVGNFHFYFMDDENVNLARSNSVAPLTIVVYVKEFFEWDYQKRKKGKETIWSSADIKKYGKLTVIGLRVYGEVNATK